MFGREAASRSTRYLDPIIVGHGAEKSTVEWSSPWPRRSGQALEPRASIDSHAVAEASDGPLFTLDDHNVSGPGLN